MKSSFSKESSESDGRTLLHSDGSTRVSALTVASLLHRCPSVSFSSLPRPCGRISEITPKPVAECRHSGTRLQSGMSLREGEKEEKRKEKKIEIKERTMRRITGKKRGNPQRKT